MGSAPGGYIFGDNETPRRRIFLKAFYIDKYEVTNRRFRKFFAPVNRYAGSFEEPGQPVVGVTWFQARDYCARVSRRLPTEAEWEKAARGSDGRIYPWGDERATCARAVMGGEIPSCSKGFATWSVGSRPRVLTGRWIWRETRRNGWRTGTGVISTRGCLPKTRKARVRGA